MLCLIAQSCPTLCTPMDCSPPGSCVHGDSPGKNTGAGCHALLQGIFPAQGSNPGVPHCRRIPPGQPKNTGVGTPSLLQGIRQPGINPGSPESQADSLPAELPGKRLCFSYSVLYLKLLLHLFICLPFVVDGLFCVSFSVILFSLCMYICVCVCVLLGILEGLDS